jgi:hypothetical protein
VAERHRRLLSESFGSASGQRLDPGRGRISPACTQAATVIATAIRKIAQLPERAPINAATPMQPKM